MPAAPPHRFITLNRDLKVVAAKRDTAPVLEGLRMEDLMVWLDAKQLAVPNVPMIQKKPGCKALLQTHMDEREAYLAAEGLTVRSPTPEQDTTWESRSMGGGFPRPRRQGYSKHTKMLLKDIGSYGS